MNKIIKMTVLTAIMFLNGSLSVSLRAEDYPAEYIGNGFREYLSGRISAGYPTEEFTKIDMLLKERMANRNKVEKLVNGSYQAAVISDNGILGTGSEIAQNFKDNLDRIASQRQQRGRFGMSYFPSSDGSIAYSKDGLTDHVDNERVVDELGNLSLRNSYNYKYDDRRLLTSFEYDSKDNLGNPTHVRQYGMQYTPDSVFYATNETNANKNLREYFVEEADLTGNIKVTHVFGTNFEGKLQRSFQQTSEDKAYSTGLGFVPRTSSFTRSNIVYENNNSRRVSSYHEEGTGVDGVKYSIDQSGITYNDKHQVTGYHQEKVDKNPDGSAGTKTITDAQYKYLNVGRQFGPDVEEPDPDRLLETTVTTRTINLDDSEKTETTTTKFAYDNSQKLINAQANSVFTGQDENGNNKYQGFSQTQYENLYGELLTKEVVTRTGYYRNKISDDELQRTESATTRYTNSLVNNLPRALFRDEHTETIQSFELDPSYTSTTDISLKYDYDSKGNLTGLTQVPGTGIGHGWEYEHTRGWYGEYNSIITREYQMFLGNPGEPKETENKEYINKEGGNEKVNSAES